MTSKKHGLMRVFWPSDAPKDGISGILVGWRNSDLDVLVVSVLQGVEVGKVKLRKYDFRANETGGT